MRPSDEVAKGGDLPSKRRPTSTSEFGVGRRESHDSSAFYSRFALPEVSADDEVGVNPPQVLDRIYQGDSRNMTELADNSVALVVTSPPYFAGKEYEQALGEGHVPATYLEYLEMLEAVFAECARKLEPGGRMAINVANLGRKPFRSLAGDVTRILQDDLGLLLRGEVVWAKAEGASGSCAWGSFRSPANPVLRDVTERIVIASKGRFDRALTAAQRRAAGRPSVPTATNDEFLDATLDVWRFAPESARRVSHPAPFPIELPERLIHLYTYEGDVVLDPFCGSGTTLVAAARTGRHGIGVDTDPEYVAIANERAKGPEAQPVAATPTGEPSAARGSAMSALAEAALTDAGFTITGRNARVKGTGLAVDLVVTDAAGTPWDVEVVGAHTVPANGLQRMDAVWRSLGRAAVLQTVEGRTRHRLLLTSHLPAPGTEGDLALRAAVPGLYTDVLEVLAPETASRLARWAAGGEE